MKTIRQIASDLQNKNISSLELVEQCLEKISAQEENGKRIFLHVDKDAARKTAKSLDHLRAAGISLSPLMGIPVSVKDLFDIKGQVTKAGSTFLKDQPPATADATAIHYLRNAGAILMGRTNMTEFAYSGLGINSHYDTPSNPYKRAQRLLPGGSSSGAGVSVADEMVTIGIGTDTGGSIRIPAALCGVTGFKPTARTVSQQGVLPLSRSLDSVGPIGPSVECCVITYQVLQGNPPTLPSPLPLQGLRLAIPKNRVLEDLDTHVAKAFEDSLRLLREKGVQLFEIQIEPFNRLQSGPLVAAEAYAYHRKWIEQYKDSYDPMILKRILPGKDISAADFLDILDWRKSFIETVSNIIFPYDALVMPTVPQIAPKISDLEKEETLYNKTNLAMLRNTALINILDGCAFSLPCHQQGDPPVGLMLAAGPMQDKRLIQMALSIEKVL